MSDREGLLEVMAHWGQLPLTIERARQTDAESLTDAILASDWLAALKADVRKAALAEFADDYQRKYENIEPSDSEGRGYWRGARNAVEHVLAAIRAAALGAAPTGGQ